MMKLEHQFSVPATIEETWAAFNDLELVVPCFPGATLSSFEGDEFTGSCKVKLGPISLLYNGSGQFVQRDESAYRAVLEAKGKDRRGNGTASATVTAQLSSDGGTSTSVRVDTELAITGKPAQFGRGVMQDVSDKMLAQFIECLQTKLGPPAAAPEAPPEAAAAEPVAEPAGGEAPPPAPAPAAPRPAATELNLGATVLPVLARRYGPYAVGLVVFLLVLRWILRRR